MKNLYFGIKKYPVTTVSCVMLVLLAGTCERSIAQAVVSDPMTIGRDCNRTSGNNFKVFSYAPAPARTLTQIGASCSPSLASPGFSPTGGSIAFSPADQKVYYIETTTGNNSIVWSWTPGTCPTGSMAPVYTYTGTFIVGLEFNPVTGDGYQVEFVGATPPYTINLRKVTSFGPPLVAGAPQQIILPAVPAFPSGIKIYQQNGDITVTPSGKLYLALNNKLFTLDYSTYGTGVLNATYIDTLLLGAGVNIVGLSYANGKLVASASDNGANCIYKEIDLSTSPVTLNTIAAPAGSAAGRTFSSLDMASLITGIGAAKTINAVIHTGGNAYQVKYDIRVKNYGNVNLTAVQLIDDLKTAFGASVFVSASVVAVGTLPPGLTINSAFNGSTNMNIFTTGGTMKATPQDSATVRVTVNLNNPGVNTIYNNSAVASATGSFFSINVKDSSDDQLSMNPDVNHNDVPDDLNEGTPTPFRLNDWLLLSNRIVDFNAQPLNNYTDLTWSLVGQDEPVQMSIQRSSVPNGFTTISTMPADISADLHKYKWTDLAATPGINYYRIQFVSVSGGTFYSDIVKVDTRQKAPVDLLVSPVPFTEKISMSVELDKNEEIDSRLIDMNGIELRSGKTNGIKGKNNFTMENLSGLRAGTFILEVRTGDAVYKKLIVKIK
jgi:uncharacterized repeat protein (TIGR01451 family)